MKQLLLILLIILFPLLAQAQTAEEYFDMGIAKSNKGDWRGAMQDYNKAIELEPIYTDAYINRGVAKGNLGQKDSGCLDLSKAGEMGYMRAHDLIKKYCQ